MQQSHLSDRECLSAEPVFREGDMPYSTIYGDFFYSRADGRAECRHVFHEGNALPERLANCNAFTIGELGFGTGLNFLETCRLFHAVAPVDARLTFHSFEAHPMSIETMQRALSAWPDLAGADDLLAIWPRLAERAAAPVREAGFGRVRLVLHVGDALACLGQASFHADAWFLDGFAPARNPAMWSEDLMREVASHTLAGGTCSTYSAAGSVRRNLAAAGFQVVKCKGFAGKRDMVRANLPKKG